MKVTSFLSCLFLGSFLYVILFGAVLLLALSSDSWAVGKLGFDSSTFLKSSDVQDDLAGTLSFGVDIEKGGSLLEGKLNFEAFMYVDEPSSFTLESEEIYFATSPELVPDGHQLSFGRKKFSWSEFDDHWKFGLWSPRFRWDPLRPKQVGLTGVFYHYKSPSWSVQVMATPISIPERGYPLYTQGGDLVSPSRHWNPLPESVAVFGDVNADIFYTIEYPPLSDLIFRPSAAARIRFGNEYGYWAAASYGYLAVNQPDLAVDAKLDAQAFNVDAKIYPRIRSHHLLSFESGFKGRRWSIWASATGEAPIDVETPDGYLTNPMGPSLILAAGSHLNWGKGFSLHASGLYIKENPSEAPGAIGDVELPLPHRFDFKSAIRAGATWDGISPFRYDFTWTYDYEYGNGLVSIEAQYPSASKAGEKSWYINLGLDLIITDNLDGFFGDFEGNDRLRGGLTYVF